MTTIDGNSREVLIKMGLLDLVQSYLELFHTDPAITFISGPVIEIKYTPPGEGEEIEVKEARLIIRLERA